MFFFSILNDYLYFIIQSMLLQTYKFIYSRSICINSFFPISQLNLNREKDYMYSNTSSKAGHYHQDSYNHLWSKLR
jgi:hypothetical protein